MMSFLISTLLSFSFAATSPIQSKEEIKFISKADNKLLDTFKTDAYIGTIGRVDEKAQDLSLVDLYTFKDSGKIAMDEKLCKEFLKQVYGPLEKITLKVKNIKVYKSHTGNTCEAQVDDPDQKSTIPERRIIIGFLKVKPYAIEFNLVKKSTPDVQENIRRFWDSLR
jgi:hypothetical protein